MIHPYVWLDSLILNRVFQRLTMVQANCLEQFLEKSLGKIDEFQLTITYA